MTAVEILSSKNKQLIGISASIAAGCQPCTLSFAAAARDAGACERGVRFALESGLAARERATSEMSSFAEEKLAHPAIDAAFRADRAQLDALIAVAAAVASNSASRIAPTVEKARMLGASDAQIRLASEVAQVAQRGAQRETEKALEVALGGKAQAACCTPGDEAASSCGCAKDDPSQVDFEAVRIEKTRNTCSLCEEHAKRQAQKPIVVMSCEGACLRGEISRQAANHLCHVLAPENTVRLCLGSAFTKDGGQRALVRGAKRVIALDGCLVRCASRMMRGPFPSLKPEVILTDGLCDFDRSLYGAEELPADEVQRLGHAVAAKVAARL